MMSRCAHVARIALMNVQWMSEWTELTSADSAKTKASSTASSGSSLPNAQSAKATP